MKYTLFALLLMTGLFVSCNADQMKGKGLAGKKELLREKKANLSELKAEIAALQAEIDDLDTTKKAPVQRLVTIQPLEKSDFERFIEIQANVRTGETVMASTEVGGRVIQLTVDEGQAVNKGKLIARIDLENLDKQMAELRTSLGLANDLYDRQKRLWDQKIGTEVQFLQAKNNKERLEKSLETLEFQRRKSNVYAPISGVVNTVYTETGEMAGPGAPIVEIMDSREVKVVAEVPENYLKAVGKGDIVTLHFPALNMDKEARVKRIGSTINPANRTFEVEVEVPNRDGLLKPNLLAIMKISEYKKEDAVTVPLEIVQQEVGGKDYVFVVSDSPEGQKAKKQYIETGETYDGRIVVEEGLNGTEQIILQGARGLVENELIKVSQTDSPATLQTGSSTM